MTERFETFTVLIAKISRNIRRIKNMEMAEYQLRSSHISCLYYLFSESLTPSELSERCEEDKATISRSIDYLEKNGFIKADQSAYKKYKTPLVLTEKGEEAGRRISEKIGAVLDEMNRALSEEERVRFYRSLSIISDELDVIEKRYEDLEKKK